MVRYLGAFAGHHHLRPRVVPGPGAQLPGPRPAVPARLPRPRGRRAGRSARVGGRGPRATSAEPASPPACSPSTSPSATSAAAACASSRSSTPPRTRAHSRARNLSMSMCQMAWRYWSTTTGVRHASHGPADSVPRRPSHVQKTSPCCSDFSIQFHPFERRLAFLGGCSLQR